jgi:arginase
VDGYRHLNEVVAWNRAVHEAVHAELQGGRLPILLGGDHCLAIGSISAVARHCREAGKKLRVLWLDAHADFNTSELTPSGNIHGMPVACLCGFGPRELVEIGGQVPAISPKWCARSASAASTPARSASCTSRTSRCSTCATSTRWACATPWSWRWPRWTPTRTCTSASTSTSSTPRSRPAWAPPCPAADYREAQLCMEMIADTGRMASLDVMELNPALDEKNLIESLFGKSTLMRK